MGREGSSRFLGSVAVVVVVVEVAAVAVVGASGGYSETMTGSRL